MLIAASTYGFKKKKMFDRNEKEEKKKYLNEAKCSRKLCIMSATELYDETKQKWDEIHYAYFMNEILWMIIT